MAAYEGTMATPEGEVLTKLASIDFPRHRTKIKKGWVKDTISNGELPTQIAFAYIDLDFYDPIKDALHFVDSRMPLGATSLWTITDGSQKEPRSRLTSL